MMLAPFSSELDTIRRDLDSLFNTSYTVKPAAEVWESDDAYNIRLELPGLTSDNISVEFNNSSLIVSAERTSERCDGMRSEFHYGSFRRSFPLPKPVDKDETNATHKDGILAITIPKTERRDTVKVQVT